MKISRYIFWAVAGVAVLVAAVPRAVAQTDRLWLTAGSSNYATGSNWTGGVVPEAQFNERAIINNAGTAVVSSAIPFGPSAIILGQAAGNSGTLEIANGGTLTVDLLTGNQGLGTVAVGAAGTGTLRVLPGGTLEADGALTSGNNAANTIVLGGTAAGTATVNVASATFGGTTQAFLNVNFNSAGQINFGATSAYTANITATGAPLLKSALSTVLGGTLNVNFSGVTPTLGSSWNLFEAGAVVGAFNAINVTGAPALGPGQRYAVNSVPAPGNRAHGALVLEQFLQLNVDRGTGAISISNAGAQAFGVQGYTVTSAAGSLSATAWNSIDDQNALGGDWRESNPTATRLSELKPTGSSNLAAAGNTALGNAFVPHPATFGTQIEDLVFQYIKSDGSVANGVVNYTGAPRPNNLLLTVDPATGAGSLRNTSTLPVLIDGYTIRSASNSLSPSGWNSLDDQNAAGGDWRESNPNAGRLSELKPTSSTTLDAGASFQLGNLFTVGGTSDLSLTFSIANVGDFTGVVTYGAISAGIQGDYNNNGTVDAADYVLWRNSIGSPTLVNRGTAIAGPVGQQDYDFWRARFGATAGSGAGLASATAVPEPATCWLVVVAGMVVTAIAGQRARNLGM